MAKSKDKDKDKGKGKDEGSPGGNPTVDDLIKDYKAKLADKIKSGETKLAGELVKLKEAEREQPPEPEEKGESTKSEIRNPKAEIEEDEIEDDEIGIPSQLYIPRHYTMTEAARKQRRDRRSKGGKASAKKYPNKNLKHGKYARSTVTAMKRCKTTCEKYPCELIAQNEVSPGELCLDMVFVVQTYEAIMKAVNDKDYAGFNEIAAFNISLSVEVLRMCLEDIIRDGTMVKSHKVNADGQVIGFEVKPHPSLLVVPKLLAELGMTPQEAMITPRQIAKQGSEEDGVKSIADLIGAVGKLKKPNE